MTHWHDTMVDRSETDGAGLRHGLDHFRASRARHDCCGLGFRALELPRRSGASGPGRGQPVILDAHREEAVHAVSAALQDAGQAAPSARPYLPDITALMCRVDAKRKRGCLHDSLFSGSLSMQCS